MNNNEPETPRIRTAKQRVSRLVVPGLTACLLAAAWAQPASANIVTEFNAMAR